MPKTKFQDFVFTVIMVFIMVYCMTFYNLALEYGVKYSTFSKTFLDMWYEAIAAFFAQRYIAGPAAKKLVSRFFKPGVDNPLFIILTMASFTVAMMAPIMTLFVTILHYGLIYNIPLLWLPKLVLNFPFALCIQIFYVGPLVRFIFRTLFRKQLSQVPAKIRQEAKEAY